MAIVYCATNKINGHQYIGVTKRTLKKRMRCHLDESRRPAARRVFIRALRKHGINGFEWSVLRDFLFVEDAYLAEARYVAKFRPVYNMTAGGAGIPGYVHTMATRNKAKKMAALESRKSLWAQYRHLGPATSSRSVRCLDDGAVYESASAAARHYGVPKSAVIELCLGKNTRKQVNGQHFCYADGSTPPTTPMKKRKLTETDVKNIRSLVGVTIYRLAKLYGLSQATMRSIVLRETWKDV